MMNPDFRSAHIAGFECLAAWSDLLDQINVFPVADGDTGRNLVVSLAPLRVMGGERTKTIHQLMLQGRGNSGNIAARFFAAFLEAETPDQLLQAARDGRSLAYKAVHRPVAGTMLTVFDALVAYLEAHPFEDRNEDTVGILTALEGAVKSTPELLPRLKAAGVVDSGALGMFLFFSGFFSSLTKTEPSLARISEIFDGKLKVRTSFKENQDTGHCVDTVIQLQEEGERKIEELSVLGESIVVIPHGDFLKVHFHTQDVRAAEESLSSLGTILKWSDDDINRQITDFSPATITDTVHIMTDAAGSLTREDARRLNVTLLDSYLTVGDESLPETRFDPARLYAAMRRGVKVSTSQASVFERYQHYQRVLQQYRRVLYLAVGSIYTGNYVAAMEWKEKNDPENRLTVIDTGAASGRLGTIVIATTRFAEKGHAPESVAAFANQAAERCKEFVFLDKLKYLAAGGRLSWPGALLGDLFKAKPIITPVAEGAKKVGLVKNRDQQLSFARDRLKESFDPDATPFIMLEYTDNYTWVNETVRKEVEALYPRAEIQIQPMSLTSGAHMGPGTWGVAFSP